MEIDFKKKRTIYLGRRLGNSNKIFHAYIEQDKVKELNTISNNEIWFKEKALNASIGSIIIFSESQNLANNFQYEGKTDEDMTFWIEKDKLVYQEYKANQDIKKIPKTKYNQLIKELKEISDRLPKNQKTIFINKILLDLSK